MSHIQIKQSTLWVNIGEIAVQNGKFSLSVYDSAYFYDDCLIRPRNLVF